MPWLNDVERPARWRELNASRPVRLDGPPAEPTSDDLKAEIAALKRRIEMLERRPDGPMLYGGRP